jgi:hypothetical protein
MLIALIATTITLGSAPDPSLGDRAAAALESQQVTMSQVHEDDVTLEALIARVRSGTVTVAIVRLATPDHVKRTYPVHGKGEKTCPPYDFIEYRATVESVMRQGENAPKLPAGTLSIVPANVPDLVYLSHLACVDGTSKSPIWQRFSGVGPAPDARRIVFLNHDPKYGWLELMSGAWLDAADRDKIERMLTAP